MNLKETISRIREAAPKMQLVSAYEGAMQDKPYRARNLIQLRNAIDSIADIDFLKGEISAVKNSGLYENLNDSMALTVKQHGDLENALVTLRIGLPALINYYDQVERVQNEQSQSTINIKLPEITDFEIWLG